MNRRESVDFDYKTEFNLKKKLQKKIFGLKLEYESQEACPPSEEDFVNHTKVNEKEYVHKQNNLDYASNKDSESKLSNKKRSLMNDEDLSNSDSKLSKNSNYNGTNPEYNSGRWTEMEHKKFLEAILIYGNEWKKVQRYISTRSSTQARSHAQKFFLKLKKNFKISEEINDSPLILFDEKEKKMMDSAKYDSIIKYFTGNENSEEAANFNDSLFISKDQRKKLISIVLNFTDCNQNQIVKNNNPRNIRFKKAKRILNNKSENTHTQNFDSYKPSFSETDSSKIIFNIEKIVSQYNEDNNLNKKKLIFNIRKIKKETDGKYLNSKCFNENFFENIQNNLTQSFLKNEIPNINNLGNSIGYNDFFSDNTLNILFNFGYPDNSIKDVLKESKFNLYPDKFNEKSDKIYSEENKLNNLNSQNCSTCSFSPIDFKNNIYDELKDLYSKTKNVMGRKVSISDSKRKISQSIGDYSNIFVNENDKIFSDKNFVDNELKSENNIQNPFFLTFDTQCFGNIKSKSEPYEECMMVEYEKMLI